MTFIVAVSVFEEFEVPVKVPVYNPGLCWLGITTENVLAADEPFPKLVMLLKEIIDKVFEPLVNVYPVKFMSRFVVPVLFTLKLPLLTVWPAPLVWFTKSSIILKLGVALALIEYKSRIKIVMNNNFFILFSDK